MMITPFLFIIRSSAQKDKCQSEKVKNKEENADGICIYYLYFFTIFYIHFRQKACNNDSLLFHIVL